MTLNRMRLPMRVAGQLRSILPDSMPLFVRVSATDWVEGGWDIDQSIVLAGELRKLGVDLIDVSSGAIAPHVKIPAGPGYQVPFAARIRAEAGIRTGAVGMITDPDQARSIITRGDADMVLLARELARATAALRDADPGLSGAATDPTDSNDDDSETS